MMSVKNNDALVIKLNKKRRENHEKIGLIIKVSILIK